MTASVRPEGNCPEDVQMESAIDVLSDEYACRILAALDEGPMPATDLADACDMSRPTVYRRLERLEEFGFVASQLTYDPDGHHRKQFRLALEEVRFEVGEDGLGGSVSFAEPRP